MQTPAKPQCPDHPEATVVPAKGIDRRDWICLVCGKPLGEARRQPEDDDWETDEIERKQ